MFGAFKQERAFLVVYMLTGQFRCSREGMGSLVVATLLLRFLLRVGMNSFPCVNNIGVLKSLSNVKISMMFW